MNSLARIALVVSALMLPVRVSHAEPVWSIDGSGQDESGVFGEVKDVLRLVDGRTAILDSQQGIVRLFDDHGQHLLTIRCEGDGPGEVRNPVALVEFPAGRLSVVQARPPKLAMLELDGEEADGWIPEFPEKDRGLSIVDAASAAGVLVMRAFSARTSAKSSSECVRLLKWPSESFDPVVLLERCQESGRVEKVAREWGSLDELTVWALDTGGRVIIAPSPDSFEMRVLAAPDSMQRVDRLADYERVKRPRPRYEEIRARYEAMAKYVPGVTGVEVSEFERDVQRIFAAPDGGYYVLSSQSVFGVETSRGLELIRFDSEGNRSGDLELEVDLRRDCDLFWISRGYLYVIRGGKSAFRAARRTSTMADEILGSDPCDDEARFAEMTIECHQLGS